MVLSQLERHIQKMKLGPYLTPYIKINTKWIKDLNVTTKTTRSLEENIGVSLYDLTFDNEFLDMTRTAQATKEKLDFIKIKNFHA